MSETQLHNPLIRRHKDGEVEGWPKPEDYPEFDDFVKAQRIWLKQVRVENAQATYKLMDGIRRTTDSYILQYLSGILHIRKEYAAFLTRGIEGCNNFLGLFEI